MNICCVIIIHSLLSEVKKKSLGITPIKMGQPALKPPLKLKIWKGVSVGAHISTLDGQRYPFAKCGTYEMWGLRGVPAKALGGAPGGASPIEKCWFQEEQ